MGVYVKGMKMPKDCRECPFEGYHVDIGQTYCMACLKVLATAFKPIPFDGRPRWCPLVEVPEPHGRLIEKPDVSEYEVFDEDTGTREISLLGLMECHRMVEDAPTVIEAEGE